ncbi:hypothetical protein GO986_03370 [Deinococcus sp. HMF7620]|uniref:Uncharacterized protein n=1 Tax=Deinococcus arboris TaxID=2682977 RepID=A0A7C9LS20_9DEIO|nr:hypothetical protein [Deinococcus arboris]MVN85800.1 hypothetical protein [Deinococcus arboris]
MTRLVRWLTLTAALASPALAQSQPHPQAGATWTFVLGAQMMTFKAKGTDKDGDALGQVNVGGRQLSGFVLHEADALRFVAVDKTTWWICRVPTTGLTSSSTVLNGAARVYLSQRESGHDLGTCRGETRNLLPQGQALTWAGIPAVGDWEIDTPDGIYAARLTSFGKTPSGQAVKGRLGDLGAAPNLLALTTYDPQGFSINFATARPVELQTGCLASLDGLKDGVLQGQYLSSGGTPVGLCVMRPARTTLPRLASALPRWPLALGAGQVWEMGMPEGTFTGVAAERTASGELTGGWFGPTSGLLSIERVDGGSAQERVFFFRHDDQGVIHACVVEQGRDIGIAKVDQFDGPGLQLTNRVLGRALRQEGDDLEATGECWVRPVVTGLK